MDLYLRICIYTQRPCNVFFKLLLFKPRLDRDTTRAKTMSCVKTASRQSISIEMYCISCGCAYPKLMSEMASDSHNHAAFRFREAKPYILYTPQVDAFRDTIRATAAGYCVFPSYGKNHGGFRALIGGSLAEPMAERRRY